MFFSSLVEFNKLVGSIPLCIETEAIEYGCSDTENRYVTSQWLKHYSYTCCSLVANL